MSDRPQACSYKELWDSLRARMARTLAFQEDRIWVSVGRPEPDKLPTGPLIIVRLLKEIPASGYSREPSGSGRFARRVYGTLLVTVWNRLTRDRAGTDEQLLFDREGGILVLAEQVLDGLDQKVLTLGDREDGRKILTAPLHWSEDGDQTEREWDRSHGGVPVQFEYERLRDINTSSDTYS